MATTAVIAKIWEDGQKKRFVTLGNIGDSRGYLLRDKKLLRLTHDQTFVQMLVDAHLLSDDEAIMTPLTKTEVLTAAARRPELRRLYSYLEYLEKSEGKETFTVNDISNMVLQSVGSSPVLKVDDLTLTPEIVTREVEVGNLIILTTDGVHGNLVDEKIAKFAARFTHDAQGLADALVNGALDFTLQHDPKNEPRLHSDDMTTVVIKID